jgi:hypothetical protein
MKSWKSDNIYAQRGYRDRAHYLRRLAASLDIPLNEVQRVANELGHRHDFTSLPDYLEDYLFLKNY